MTEDIPVVASNGCFVCQYISTRGSRINICNPTKVFASGIVPWPGMWSTVDPRLSVPRLSGLSPAQQCNVRMRRGRGRLHLVGVAIAERSAGHVCWLETARNDK